MPCILEVAHMPAGGSDQGGGGEQANAGDGQQCGAGGALLGQTG